jgi:plasmid stability protein
MSDILVRDVPEDVIAALDVKANEAGLSRVEYLRRLLVESTQQSSGQRVTAQDWERFALSTADLANEEVMAQAWS